LGFDFTHKLGRPGEWTRRIAFVSAGVAAGLAYTFAVLIASDGGARALFCHLADNVVGWPLKCYLYPSTYGPEWTLRDFLPSHLSIAGWVALVAAAPCVILARLTGREARADRALRLAGALPWLGMMLVALDQSPLLLKRWECAWSMGSHGPYEPFDRLYETISATAVMLILLGLSTLLLAGGVRRYLRRCGTLVHVGLCALSLAGLDMCWCFASFWAVSLRW